MTSYPFTSRAAVLGPDGLRTTQVEVPSSLPAGGLLQVEAAAVCGSDLHHYRDESFRKRGEVILGHENAGSIVSIADEAADLWGLDVGDRVYVEEFIGCKSCSQCATGQYNLCARTDWRSPGTLRYGRTPISVTPGLWGGFSEYLYLHPHAFLHKLPASLSSEVAVWANPVANGMRWLYEIAALRPGERVVIVGPGPHGLGCAMAAQRLTSEVAVVGLSGDEGRLRDARRLGVPATHIVGERPLDQCFRFEDGAGPDVVIDLTRSHDVLQAAITNMSKGGRIVLAGHKPEQFSTDQLPVLSQRELRVLGVSGPTYNSVSSAIKYLDRSSQQMEGLNTLICGIEDVERAFRVVAGEEGLRPTHAVIAGSSSDDDSHDISVSTERGGVS